MFTDRFLKVPSRIYNPEKKDLTGVKDLVKTNIRILPMEISEYYASFDDDEEIEGTQIYMKNGESLWVNLLPNLTCNTLLFIPFFLRFKFTSTKVLYK